MYTVVAVVITASATLLAVHVTNRGNTSRLLFQLRHERDARRDVLHREKLEELYLLAVKYSELLAIGFLPYVRVMEGKLNYNQALDLEIARDRESTPDFDRLQMLVDIYFPELCEPLKELLDARDESNGILAAHKAEYKQGHCDGREFVEPMFAALERVDDAGKRFLSKIVAREKAVR